MASFATAFDRLYAAGFPGAVDVTLSGGGVIQAHFWSEPATDTDGFIALHATRQRLQAPTARFGALRRGDQVTVGGKSYHCVTGPVDDGHGIADVYLEPVA